MSRKTERRARRQAINELLARQEPPSRLDQLDHHGKTRQKPNSETPSQGTAAGQRPLVPEQAGPLPSETTELLGAHRK